jgi:predicted cytidylate kinase
MSPESGYSMKEQLMETHRSIVISGDLGSGKSTISKRLEDLLGIRRISMGDLYRNTAEQLGMSALQINLHAERNEILDDEVDQLQARLARSHEQLIVDSRLGWFFFREALKVHLIADSAVAAQRVMSRPASTVEAYSSISEAIERLKKRSQSERDRFVRKYGVDKSRLRNYDLVCDTSSASPDEIMETIVLALQNAPSQGVSATGAPLLAIDPKRIFPSKSIRELRGLWDSPFVAAAGVAGFRVIEPISIAYNGEDFYAVDGHRRLSTALQNGFTLILGRLIAEADEPVTAQLNAQQYFENEVGLSVIYDWEAAHSIRLPLPPHLQAAT